MAAMSTSRRALFAVLAALAFLPGCIVNPVPTPDSETAALRSSSEPPTGSSDASGKHNNPNAGGGSGDSDADGDGALNSGVDAVSSPDAGSADATTDTSIAPDAASTN